MRVVQDTDRTHPFRRRRPGTTPSAAVERRHAGLRVLVLCAVRDAGAPVTAEELRAALNLFALRCRTEPFTEVLADLACKAVELGGTVSAEHGLGKRKAHLLAIQYAPEHLETMRAVKRRLDPGNILGRGTIWA